MRDEKSKVSKSGSRAEATFLEIVDTTNFIQAIRDSGIKKTTIALAELVDNAVEAGATKIELYISRAQTGLTVQIVDDGSGMGKSIVERALSFGGSTRFASRAGLGRFGIGLPAASLSQAKTVKVESWATPTAGWECTLDADAVAREKGVPPARRFRPRTRNVRSPSGTRVSWTNCDRLDFQKVESFEAAVHADIGRIFRKFLSSGLQIQVNGKTVTPKDPLFLHSSLLGGSNRATRVGEILTFELIPSGEALGSKIEAEFSLLPIREYADLDNKDKNAAGITRAPNVSVVRNGREIDRGWFFMGGKRRENYDAWWRCEIRFSAELDEQFGVSNVKQAIRPTKETRDFLSSRLEPIGRALNKLVRETHAQIEAEAQSTRAVTIAARHHHRLPPSHPRALPRGVREISIGSGLNKVIRLIETELQDTAFYAVSSNGTEVTVLLNTAHPFYSRLYKPLQDATYDHEQIRLQVDLLLLAAARSEAAIAPTPEVKDFLRIWSNATSLFLNDHEAPNP